MSENDLRLLLAQKEVAPWRIHLARLIETPLFQKAIISTILLNALVLGLETSKPIVTKAGNLLTFVDQLCLFIFIIELSLKLAAYRFSFWRSGWNWFDFAIVAVALAPGAGPWSVLRSLRILRVLRLLTVVPQLRKVIEAFIHAVPGLGGVIIVMAVFFYTMAVLALNLFGSAFPQWFGTLGASLYSLFQIMTLESWSMGIVRPVMEVYPWAWAFFVPFIIIATFTILNLFIGIIVSTMQELSTLPDLSSDRQETIDLLRNIEKDLDSLRSKLLKDQSDTHLISPKTLRSNRQEHDNTAGQHNDK